MEVSGGDPGDGGRKASVGTGRKAGQHVILCEPAWSAHALHDEFARLAVQRLEMMAIACGHLDAGRHGNVETGFVMEKDDVREFTRRPAGGGLRQLHAFSYRCVRFQISVPGEFMNSLDAGAREFGDIILADKI